MSDRSIEPDPAGAHPTRWLMTHYGPYQAGLDAAGRPQLAPDPADPAPTPLGLALAEVDHRLRIRRPAARSTWLAAVEAGRDPEGSGRGAAPFVELPWDEALDLAAAELARIHRDHGPTAIYGGSYGWGSAGWFHRARAQLHRLLAAAGGFTMGVGTYSHGAAERMIPHVLGLDFAAAGAAAPDWDEIATATDILVSFGGIPLRNTQLDWGGIPGHRVGAALARALDRGLDMVTVAPIADDAAAAGRADWVRIRPGTDAALILALLHALITDGLIDRPALDRLTHGWPVLEAHILGRDGTAPKTPAWAAGITGIPDAAITALARRLAGRRALIAMAWAVQRHQNGEMAVWAAHALAAALGQIGLPGGGVGIGYGAGGGFGLPQTGRRPGLIGALPNPQGMEVPVSRFADILLAPGATIHHDGRRITAPDIRLVWWAGGNPFHHHQDLNRLIRAWAVPRTIIVQDMVWTQTARRADLVLPATGPLERADIAGGLQGPTIIAADALVPPVGEARDDHAILAAIADRLGCRAAFDDGLDAEAWLARLWDRARNGAPNLPDLADLPDLAGLRALGRIDPAPLPDAARQRAGRLAHFRADPEAGKLPTPSGRIELASEAIAAMGLPAHPCWQPPAEWAGSDLTARFPLHLLSPQPATRLHGQLDHAAHSLAAKHDGRERVMLHPDDAAARGIAEGDCVMIWNDRGACLAAALLSTDIMPGVAALPTGAWYDPSPTLKDAAGRPVCRHGNPNLLTRDAGSSPIAQAPAAQTCLVEIRRLDPATAAAERPSPHEGPMFADRDTLTTTSPHAGPAA
jgi:biotin/methionine sulfoxide reductase